MKVNSIFWFTLVILLSGLMLNGCQSGNGDNQKGAKKAEPDDLGQIAALPDTCRYPVDNPPSLEKTELGRLLFYDPILSGGKDVSCATCHHPEFMYAESLELSIGVNGTGLGEHRLFSDANDIPFTKRNSQSLLNTAFNGIDITGRYSPETAPMFWDLRAHGLEEQAQLPIKTLEEMRGHSVGEENMTAEVVKRLNTIPEYRKLFKNAFPGMSVVTIELVAKSLATFQRSLLANNSRFDKYMRGDAKALSAGEIEGMNLFIQTGCARCHNGPMLSDFKPHVLGVADNEKLAVSDSGFQGSYAFRTPTLRNLRFTRPYMHSGKIQTLESVLAFYEDLQGKELPNVHLTRDKLDPLASKLNVEFRDINSIIEFLNTLNDDQYDKKIPASVPSGLPVGGNISEK